jgi:pimeloyl-ACP methyl ester carboxylesterase
MWETQLHDLSDFHCLNVDLPGHGKSNHVRWVSIADAADQVAELIQDRATNGRAFVVGLSLGGYVTLALLERYPELVERAVLSGVTAFPLPDSLPLKLQLRVMSVFMKSPWFVRFQARMLRIPDDSLEAYTQSLLAMSREAFDGIIKEMFAYHLPPRLSEVHVPTLVTAGSLEMPSVLESVREIPRVMPAAEGYFAPGVHHGWNGEAPELFSAMLRAWFTGAPLPEQLQAETNLLASKQLETG